ncbi:mercuric transporter MerT family protein [Thiomonas sp.]
MRGSAVRYLLLAGLSAIGAMSCCVIPLLLVVLGFSGAWLGMFTALHPYDPLFIAVTLAFFAAAGRQLYRKPQACAVGKACALPAVQHRQRLIFWISLAIVLPLLAAPYVAFYGFGQ